MIDVARLDQLLTELDDDHELIAMVISTYVDQLDPRVAAIRAALSTGDPKQVSEAAHALKSSSITLGVSGVAGPAAQLETEARSGALENAVELLGRIEAAAPEARTALLEYAAAIAK
ncbi:MAG: Hpt domain-containing protein [Acidimicrobiia bacterium]